MDEKLIYWITGFIVALGYAFWYRIVFKKWPYSWSSTYYDLEKKYGRNAGYILTLAEWVMAFSLIPVVVENNPLMFGSVVSIGFLATAANYRKNKLERIVHVGFSMSSVIIAIFAFAFSYEMYFMSFLLAAFVAFAYTKLIKIKNYIQVIESLVILIGFLVILKYNVVL